MMKRIAYPCLLCGRPRLRDGIILIEILAASFGAAAWTLTIWLAGYAFAAFTGWWQRQSLSLYTALFFYET